MNIKGYYCVLIMLFMIVPISTIFTDYTTNTKDMYAQSMPTTDVLTLTFNGEHKYYSLEELLAFDSITGNGGRLKVTGDVIPPYEYTGVLITTLAQEFPSMTSTYSLTAIADDGYTLSYTYDEILGHVMVYDSNGDEIGIGGVSMILATMENGQTTYDGALRIAFVNQDEPITFSALWAKYVVELKFTGQSDDTIPPTVVIDKPRNGIYIFDNPIIPYIKPFIFGEITIEARAYDDGSGIARITLFIDGNEKQSVNNAWVQWLWDEPSIGSYSLEVSAYDTAGNSNTAQQDVFIINP